MNWLQITVDVATVVAGVAAAAALVYTARQDRKSSENSRREVANKFVAWAVTQSSEGEDFGESSAVGGVVVRNGTDEVALAVDVKTQTATPAAVPTFEDDGFKGQRFALIPPGTYYLPQVLDGGEKKWVQPIAVDDSSGQLSIRLLDDNDDLVVHHLVPVTQRPEPRRVTFLRFQVADRFWHRPLDGSLIEGPGTSAFEEQFTHSQPELPPHAGRQHQPNEASQDLVARLFSALTDGTVEPRPSALAAANARARAWGIERVRRTRGRGQGLHLMAAVEADHPRFYISGGRSGSNLEAFPNDGLQFHLEGEKDERLKVPEFTKKGTASYWSAHFEELLDILEREIRNRLS